MRTEHIAEFVTLARCGSYSEAARRLYTSQSNVSTHVRALERELGFDLVSHDRGERPTLTPAGRSFLGHAQAIVDVCEQARREGLRIASAPPAVRLPDVSNDPALFDALAHNPSFDVEFVDLAWGTSMVKAVRTGMLDIGFYAGGTGRSEIGEAEERPLTWHRIGAQRCAIAVQSGNPLARQGTLTRRDLGGAVVAIHSPSYWDALHDVIDSLLGEGAGVTCRLLPVEGAAEVSRMQLGGMLHLCEVGAVHRYYAGRNDIVIFEELDGEPLTCPLWAVTAANPSDSIRAVIAALQRYGACGEPGV